MERRTIAAIDQEISAIRRQLCQAEKINRMSAESWQSAWDKHPDLHAKEQQLFQIRGRLQNPSVCKLCGKPEHLAEEAGMIFTDFLKHNQVHMDCALKVWTAA